MAKEIERKYLVDKEKFDASLRTGIWTHYPSKQGYIKIDTASEPNISQVRVSITGHEEYETLKKFDPEGKVYRAPRAYLNIKGPVFDSCVRDEFEYEIPVEEAFEIFSRCAHKIFKERYKATIDGIEWAVDVFKLDNDGLIIAETEIESPKVVIKKPEWIGKEVTYLPQYYNVSLSQYPYNCYDFEKLSKIENKKIAKVKCSSCPRYRKCGSSNYDEPR